MVFNRFFKILYICIGFLIVEAEFQDRDIKVTMNFQKPLKTNMCSLVLLKTYAFAGLFLEFSSTKA